ncbi:DUF2147 domain-containing protein [Hydrogenophaga sp. NFH-34]|uniref:DUF2147 domain-containing protein n=1 Tax=Hydrogenophaga sp. NFH-34 TaxID=2744446 RepID=UPI001F1B0DD3|nr:DUF2147 domain-containing protein [Hydrogenophaga sp. NFH-34]
MKRKALITAAVLGGWVVSALAQMTPEGLWRNVDDKTGEAKAEIRIAAGAHGVLHGRIEKTLVSSGEPLCTECTDDRKGQPKLGLEIIRGAQKSATDTLWEGGRILDPENGKEYTLRLTPLEGGRKLQVRGYIGPFYRTQVWTRVE